MTTKTTEVKQAIAYLKKNLKVSKPIYTQTTYGRNYWNAYTKLFIMKNNEPVNITYDASLVLGVNLNKDGRIPYGDFDSVYNLGRKLYPKGYRCDGKDCHSNDHVNHGDTENTFHKDSGYRFKQRSF